MKAIQIILSLLGLLLTFLGVFAGDSAISGTGFMSDVVVPRPHPGDALLLPICACIAGGIVARIARSRGNMRRFLPILVPIFGVSGIIIICAVEQIIFG
jgi:hypothetical protein